MTINPLTILLFKSLHFLIRVECRTTYSGQCEPTTPLPSSSYTCRPGRKNIKVGPPPQFNPWGK